MKLTELDYLGAAARSTAVARQCVLPEYSLAETLAIARKATLHFQQIRQPEDLEHLYEEEATLPLIAAARTLFSVGQSLRKQIGMERYGNPDEILLTSAVAFAMYGNFPSSHAALELVTNEYLKARDGRVVAAAICDPRRVGSLLHEQRPGSVRDFLSIWERFLRSGDENLIEMLRRPLELLLLSAEVSEAGLLRNARVAMRQAVTLSVARCFSSKDSVISAAFIQGLLNDNILTLLPPQYQLLVRDRIASRTTNALLNLPTSTGKTLLAEFCMAAAIGATPGLAVIVVPYIAIGNQIIAALKRHLKGTDINVTGMFGGFKIETAIDPLRNKEIVVATPERFDAWLRSNGVHSQLKIVIFDEAHSISNSTRGARLEGLITRLRLQQRRGAAFRLIAMSAVLSESEALIDFLGVDPQDYFRKSWRPTARHLAIWGHGGDLTWLFGNDSLRPKQLTAFHPLGSKSVRWPNPLQAPPPWMRAEARPKREDIIGSQDNIAYLADYLAESIGGPVLVVCMTKESTRLVSAAIAKRLSEDPSKILRRSMLAEYAKNLAPWYTTLPSMIMKGVAFHNASLPTQLRKHIEDALCQRDLDFIVSTTTLAEGADLPFRVTILESWIVGFGPDAKPLDPLMFRNIAGRCGRAGVFTEGDTILYENLLGPSQLTSDNVRRSAMASMISTPPGLQTALPLGDGRDSKYDEDGRFAAISAQVIAAIPENPEDEELASHLADTSFAIRVRNTQSVRVLFRKIVDDLLSNANGEPFAVAASPIRLTEVGKAVNRTGFSIETSRSILSFVRSEVSISDAYQLVVEAIQEFGGVAEQPDSYLRKIVGTKKHRAFVTDAELLDITIGWLDQRDIYQIYQSLPKYKSSKAADDYKQRQFDKFIQMAESVYGNFLPWIFRACGQLSPFGASWAQQFAWNDIAQKLETRASPESFETSIVDDE